MNFYEHKLSLSHMHHFFHIQLNSYTSRHYSDITPRWLTPAASHLVRKALLMTNHDYGDFSFRGVSVNKQVDITVPKFTFHKMLTLNTSMLKYSVLPIASLTANMT